MFMRHIFLVATVRTAQNLCTFTEVILKINPEIHF